MEFIGSRSDSIVQLHFICFVFLLVSLYPFIYCYSLLFPVSVFPLHFLQVIFPLSNESREEKGREEKGREEKERGGKEWVRRGGRRDGGAEEFRENEKGKGEKGR